MIDALLRHGVVRYVARLTGVLAAAEVEFSEFLVQSSSTLVVNGQLPVEGLDVAHGPAGVPDRGSFHLVGNVSPLGMQQFQLRHHYTGDVLPHRRYAMLQNLNRQVVGPSTRVQPRGYPCLLLSVGIDPDPARLLSGSVGVRASGN